ALKDRRAVSARQDADFAGDGAEVLDAAAVDALAFENQIADDAFLHPAEGGGDLLGRVLARALGRDVLGIDAVAQPADRLGAGLLAGRLLELAELVVDLLLEGVLERVGGR